MNPYKISIFSFLFLSLLTISTVNADIDSLLKRGNQAVLLYGESDSSGILPLVNSMRIMPNGSVIEKPFPPNTVFIMTHLIWRFSATDKTLNGPVKFNIGNYYSGKVILTAGVTGNQDNIAPGIVFVKDIPETLTASVVNLDSSTAIPGILGLRIVGYLASAQ
jgi:hypothetical protein